MSLAGRIAAPVALVLLTSAAGCGPPPPPVYPGTLAPPSTLGPDFLAQQRLAFDWRGRRAELPVVLQKKGDRLLMLGLTPFGTRAFAIALVGTAVRMTSYVDEPPPLDPRWVLLDVERALHPPFTAARADGTAQARHDGERVTERWSEGRLVERTYTRIEGDPVGVIRITYDPGWRQEGPPEHLAYDNGWVGYRLTIDTHALRPL